MTTLAPVLSNRFFPRTAQRIRDVLLILAGSLLLAALAQIEIVLTAASLVLPAAWKLVK